MTKRRRTKHTIGTHHKLDLLDLRDCIVTSDAAGCQKDIAAGIVAEDADEVPWGRLFPLVKRIARAITIVPQAGTAPHLEPHSLRDGRKQRDSWVPERDA